MQADLQKLIAYGKVLGEDEKTLKDYGIKDGDFIVIMISKVLIMDCIIHHRLSHLPKKMLNKKKQDQLNSSNQQQLNRIPPKHNSQDQLVLNNQEVQQVKLKHNNQ